MLNNSRPLNCSFFLETADRSKSPEPRGNAVDSPIFIARRSTRERGSYHPIGPNPWKSLRIPYASRLPPMFTQRWNLILGTTELRNSCKLIPAARTVLGAQKRQWGYASWTIVFEGDPIVRRDALPIRSTRWPTLSGPGRVCRVTKKSAFRYRYFSNIY